MAEVLVLICDRCGQPATDTVGLKVGSRNLRLDLCQLHLDELVKGARPPKRGRRAAATRGPVSGSSARRRKAKG